MSRNVIHRKCRCCRKLFTPNYRSIKRQIFCAAPDCRRAAKAESQRRWLAKSGNRDYFRDPDHVRRVQEWRKRHPGYWKKSKLVSEESQTVDSKPVNPDQRSCNATGSQSSTLQDFCLTEHPAFLGLISMVTGSTLQDDIAATTNQVLLRGMNILGLKVPDQRQNSATSNHDRKTSPPP